MGDKRKRGSSPYASDAEAGPSTTTTKKSRVQPSPKSAPPERAVEIVWELVGTSERYSRYIKENSLDDVVPVVMKKLGASPLGMTLMHVRKGGYESPVWDDYDYQAIKARALATGSKSETVRMYSAAAGQRPPVVPLPSPKGKAREQSTPAPPTPVSAPAPVSAPTPRSALKTPGAAGTPRTQKRVMLAVPNDSPPSTPTPAVRPTPTPSPASVLGKTDKHKRRRRRNRSSMDGEEEDTAAKKADSNATASSTPTVSPAAPAVSAPRPTATAKAQLYKPARPSPLSQSDISDEQPRKKSRTSDLPPTVGTVSLAIGQPQPIPVPGTSTPRAQPEKTTPKQTKKTPAVSLPSEPRTTEASTSSAVVGAKDSSEKKAKPNSKGKAKAPAVPSTPTPSANADSRKSLASAMAAKIAAEILAKKGSDTPTKSPAPASTAVTPTPKSKTAKAKGSATTPSARGKAKQAEAKKSDPAPEASTSAPVATSQPEPAKAVSPPIANGSVSKPNGTRKVTSSEDEGDQSASDNEIYNDASSEGSASSWVAPGSNPTTVPCATCGVPVDHLQKDCPVVLAGVDRLKERLEERRAELRKLAAAAKTKKDARAFEEKNDSACDAIQQWIKRKTEVAAKVNGTPSKEVAKTVNKASPAMPAAKPAETNAAQKPETTAEKTAAPPAPPAPSIPIPQTPVPAPDSSSESDASSDASSDDEGPTNPALSAVRRLPDTPFIPSALHQQALARPRRPGSMSGLSVSDAVIETADSDSDSSDSDLESGSDSISSADSDSDSSSDSDLDPAQIMIQPLSKRQKRRVRLSAASMHHVDEEEASEIESEDEVRPSLKRRDSGSSIGDFEEDQPVVSDPEVVSDDDHERAALLEAVADATQEARTESEKVEEADKSGDEEDFFTSINNIMDEEDRAAEEPKATPENTVEVMDQAEAGPSTPVRSPEPLKSSGTRSFSRMEPSSPALNELGGDIALREAMEEDDLLPQTQTVPNHDLPATQVDAIEPESLPSSQVKRRGRPPKQAVQSAPPSASRPTRAAKTAGAANLAAQSQTEAERFRMEPLSQPEKRKPGRPRKSVDVSSQPEPAPTQPEPASEPEPAQTAATQPESTAQPEVKRGRGRPKKIVESSSQSTAPPTRRTTRAASREPPASQPAPRLTRASSREPPASQPVPRKTRASSREPPAAQAPTRNTRSSSVASASRSPEKRSIRAQSIAEESEDEATPRAVKTLRSSQMDELDSSFPVHTQLPKSSLPPSSFIPPAQPNGHASSEVEPTQATQSSPLQRKHTLDDPLFMSGGSLMQTQAYNAFPPPLVPDTQAEQAEAQDRDDASDDTGTTHSILPKFNLTRPNSQPTTASFPSLNSLSKDLLRQGGKLGSSVLSAITRRQSVPAATSSQVLGGGDSSDSDSGTDSSDDEKAVNTAHKGRYAGAGRKNKKAKQARMSEGW